MPKLFSQMEAVSHRFEELSIRLNQPETAADPALFRRLMQEYHELEPVVDAYRKLATAKDHLEQAKALPCVFNNWAVFYRGQFQTVNLLDIPTLERILKRGKK